MHKKLIIRDLRGTYHVRILWDATIDKVYVTDKDGLNRIPTGQDLGPIGFDYKDVFEFDEGAARAIESGEEWEWSKLKKWTGIKRSRAKRKAA